MKIGFIERFIAKHVKNVLHEDFAYILVIRNERVKGGRIAKVNYVWNLFTNSLERIDTFDLSSIISIHHNVRSVDYINDKLVKDPAFRKMLKKANTVDTYYVSLISELSYDDYGNSQFVYVTNKSIIEYDCREMKMSLRPIH